MGFTSKSMLLQTLGNIENSMQKRESIISFWTLVADMGGAKAVFVVVALGCDAK